MIWADTMAWREVRPSGVASQASFDPKRETKTAVSTATSDGVERKRVCMTHLKPSHAARNASCVRIMQARPTRSASVNSPGCSTDGSWRTGWVLVIGKAGHDPAFGKWAFGGNRRLVEGQGGLAHLHDSTNFQSMREYCAIRRQCRREPTTHGHLRCALV